MSVESLMNPQLPPIENPPKTAVLAGGIGEERDISIQSGNCVAEALKQSGFNVVLADITPDNMTILEDSSIDVFFPALHGKFGEDGGLQQILEDKSLCYTGSGPQASKLAFDKMATKRLLNKNGINTPAAIKFETNTDAKKLKKQLHPSENKYVIKPIRQGSSVGISIITGIDKAVAIAHKTLGKFGDCMIEEFIQGREVTVGILCDRPLPIIEIRSQTGFYDYHAKYIDDRTEFLFDTIENPALMTKIQRAALGCFNTLGCRHFARVDFILGDDQIPYVLELNTIPGFTTHSLLPKAAEKSGLSMGDLCAKIVKAALTDKNIAKLLINQTVSN